MTSQVILSFISVSPKPVFQEDLNVYFDARKKYHSSSEKTVAGMFAIIYRDNSLISSVLGVAINKLPLSPLFKHNMMTSSNGSIFRVSGNLCGEFTGHRWIPRANASDAEL